MPDLPPSPIIVKKPQEVVGLIQGQQPQSINEWYVSQALDYFKIDYTYQYALNGGHMIRGGQVVDFVAWTAIGGIPIFIQGTYWHQYRKDPETEIKQAEAARRFRNAAVLLTEEETSTREAARLAIREKVLV